MISGFSGGGGFSEAGFWAVAAVPIIVILLLGFFGIAIFPVRGDAPDPTSKRGFSIYLMSMVYVTLFTSAFAATGLAYSMSGFIHSSSNGGCSSNTSSFSSSLGAHPGSTGTPSPADPVSARTAQMNYPGFGNGSGNGPGAGSDNGGSSGSGSSTSPLPSSSGWSMCTSGSSNNAAVRGTVKDLLLLLGALALLVFHVKLAQSFYGEEGEERGPPSRVLDGYFFSVSLAGLLVAFVSAITALYAIFVLLGPGVFGNGDRSTGAHSLIAGAVGAAAFGAIGWWHLERIRTIRSFRRAAPAVGLPSSPPDAGSGPAPGMA